MHPPLSYICRWLENHDHNFRWEHVKKIHLRNSGLQAHQGDETFHFWKTSGFFLQYVHSPEIESKELMNFCELPWSKKCLEFYKRKDITSKTASNIQIRQAIYKDSKEKYLPYRQFLIKYGKKYKWFN